MSGKNIGLLFGSFNPVHNGHLDIANAALQHAGCAEVYFMLQTKNNYKDQPNLAPLKDRLAMLKLAIALESRFSQATANDSILQTLQGLPKNSYVLILGEDLATSFPQWPDYQEIIKYSQVYMYPRSQSNALDVSSKLIRKLAATNGYIDLLVPSTVKKYISKSKLYLKTPTKKL